MKKFAKIILPISIISLIAALVLFGLAKKDDLPSEISTIAITWEAAVRENSTTNILVCVGFAVLILLIGIVKAVRRRKMKYTHGCGYFAILLCNAFLIYLMRDIFMDHFVKDIEIIQYVSLGLYGFYLFLTLLLVFFSSKKVEKQPFRYRAMGPTIYLCSIFAVVLAILYTAFAKNGFAYVGGVMKDLYKYMFDFSVVWAQPRPKYVMIAISSLTVLVMLFFILLRRKRNVLPVFFIGTFAGIALAYFMKAKRIQRFMERSVADGSVLNNSLVIAAEIFVLLVFVVTIFCLVEAVISLFDPNEDYSQAPISRTESAAVRALAQEINEEANEPEGPTAPVEDEEAEVIGDEEDEDDEPAPRIVAKASQNEYADEDYDAYDDEEDEEDDDDDEEEEDEEDEEDEDDEEDDSDDDAREALRRRRELIRQRILAARADDDDEDEEDVEEDEVVGYDDEDEEEVEEDEVVGEDEDEPAEEDDEVLAEEAPAEVEPEEELDEEESEDEESEDEQAESYGGLTDDGFDDEEESDEEESEEEEDEDDVLPYDPEEDDTESEDEPAEEETETEEEPEEAEESESEEESDDEDLEEESEDELDEEAPQALEPEEELDEEDLDDEDEQAESYGELTDDGFDDESESEDEEESDDDDDEDEDDEESSEALDQEGLDTSKPLFAKIKAKPMKEKMMTVLDDEKRERYNIIRNELQSYKKVNERFSAKGDSYRYHRELIAKISISGKTLRLHLALNPDDFQNTKYSFKDLSAKSKYMYTPLTVKLTSGRSVKHSIELIGYVAEAFGLEKNPRYKEKDYAAELKSEFEASASESNDAE